MASTRRRARRRGSCKPRRDPRARSPSITARARACLCRGERTRATAWRCCPPLPPPLSSPSRCTGRGSASRSPRARERRARRRRRSSRCKMWSETSTGCPRSCPTGARSCARGARRRFGWISTSGRACSSPRAARATSPWRWTRAFCRCTPSTGEGCGRPCPSEATSPFWSASACRGTAAAFLAAAAAAGLRMRMRVRGRPREAMRMRSIGRRWC
mmetsp:Transcript_7722/g.18971  ORF Transcript_7722/g.18971 Transcript_7722/m.18971 type:complete len:215 (-) Transcript_7722:1877-2521(-)